MLRLHIMDDDVVLFGLTLETNEYARYAYQGNENEHSDSLDRRGCDARLH